MKILNELKELARELEVYDFVSRVLEDGQFLLCSGSSRSDQHHYGEAGLIQHTYEVVKLCMFSAKLYNLNKLDTQRLLISAIWHDYGKIWDYEKVEEGVYTGNIHRQRIRHLTRSAIEWEKTVETLNISCETIFEVTHAILSHHGWFVGNPHTPQTEIASILHASDLMSARVTDAKNGRWEFKQNIE